MSSERQQSLLSFAGEKVAPSKPLETDQNNVERESVQVETKDNTSAKHSVATPSDTISTTADKVVPSQFSTQIVFVDEDGEPSPDVDEGTDSVSEEERNEELNERKEETEDEEGEDVLALKELFKAQLTLSSEAESSSEPFSLSELVEWIKDGKCKRIIVMTGAGISTAAGIPDFRTPGSGLYDNLQKYDLPYAEAIFDIDYFKKRPEPFYALAKELYPDRQFKPTLSHYFVRLLADKGLLLRHYTQNIDMLERIAGIHPDLLVEAHGTFSSAHCISRKCFKSYDHLYVKSVMDQDQIPRCEVCQSLVKPDIVFFGEQLPQRFFSLMNRDFQACDLLVVMGTSLAVQPFASLIQTTRRHVPRLLVNRERCGEHPLGGFEFNSSRRKDVALLGSCDDGCLQLAERLGWKQVLLELMEKEHARHSQL